MYLDYNSISSHLYNQCTVHASEKHVTLKYSYKGNLKYTDDNVDWFTNI